MIDSLSDDIAQRLGTFLDRFAADHALAEDLDPLLAEAQAALPWPQLHLALLERVEQLDTARDRMALVIHATDLDVATEAAGKRGLDGVFEVLVAAADAPALEAFITRVTTLLEDMPRLYADLPGVARLIEIADQIEGDHPETAEALVTLAQRCEDIFEETDEA